MSETSVSYLEDRDKILTSVERLEEFKNDTIYRDIIRHHEMEIVLLRDSLENLGPEADMTNVRLEQGRLQAHRRAMALIDILIEARKEQDDASRRDNGRTTEPGA